MICLARTGFVAVLAVLMGAASAGAHPDDAIDPGFFITSDFGPRTTAGGTPFHKAIDMRRAAGLGVPLLENGTVTSLTRGNTQLVSLVVTGQHTFRYLHFFDDTALPIVSGPFVLARASDNSLAIVRLAGTPGEAAYIISPNAGNTVTITVQRAGLPLPPFTFMTPGGGAPATTEDVLTTAAHPNAGPAGGSGGFDVHMHVDHGIANNVSVSMNPLFHMADRTSRFIAALRDRDDVNRPPGYAVGPNEPLSTFLKLNVRAEPEPAAGAANSTVAKDLESVRIYVDQVDPAHLVREFVYGGQTEAHDPINTDVGNGALSNGVTNGVQTGGVGNESFVYNDWDSAGPVGQRPSDLPEGAHEFVFVLRDVHDNVPFADGVDPRLPFNVDRTAPTTVIAVKKTP
jgi:hypothetical protein